MRLLRSLAHVLVGRRVLRTGARILRPPGLLRQAPPGAASRRRGADHGVRLRADHSGREPKERIGERQNPERRNPSRRPRTPKLLRPPAGY